MTHPTITCERFNEHLADFLERAVSEPTRAAMESHAVGCEDCGPLLGDLRRLRIDAANLPELVPSRDLWSGIASRIEAPVLSLPGSGAGSRAPLDESTRPWPRRRGTGRDHGDGDALGRGWTRWTGGPVDSQRQTAQRPAPTPTPTVSSPAVAAGARLGCSGQPASPVHRSTGPTVAQPVHLASNKPSAEQTYDREIARLLVVYNQRRPNLDSTTIAVVKKNLKIIDDAIAQTKIALRRDPASQYLMESLNDAFDTKVQLLRKVAMLPSGT